MASSKKPPASSLRASKRNSLLVQTKLFLAELFSSQKLINPSLLVAFSGGLDSTVLLHVLTKLQDEFSFKLNAMHVHHGLSSHADEWVRFCEAFCTNLDIPFSTVEVDVDVHSGLGVEAAARNARYQALSFVEEDFICLAHHQDDQAETLLLQLARGAGVKGLAGMAQVDTGRRLIRPFLNFPQADLKAYAKQYQLHWIEDESNTDARFDRNFLRHKVLPVFDERYPAFSQALGRSAAHLADASNMLDDLATLDAAGALDQSQQSIDMLALGLLSRERQANLVRWWLANNKVSMPSTALLQQVLKQLLGAKSDAVVKVKVANKLHVMRYQGRAYLVHEFVASAPINICWQGESELLLPNRSRLIFTQKMGEGFAFRRGGSDIKLRIKNRDGGERFKPTLGRPNRTLKYMMQKSEIPPWQREQLPLIFMDETLVIIPNTGVDASMQAGSHELGLTVSWLPALP